MNWDTIPIGDADRTPSMLRNAEVGSINNIPHKIIRRTVPTIYSRKSISNDTRSISSSSEKAFNILNQHSLGEKGLDHGEHSIYTFSPIISHATTCI
nr:hypothetical protein [Nonomuraea pusilla]